MNKLFKTFALTCVCCLGLLACSTKLAPTTQDAQAKRFSVAANKSNIYVFRKRVAGSIDVPLILDGRQVAHTGSRTDVALEVLPGQHTLAVRTGGNSSLKVETRAGQNQFVWLNVEMDANVVRSSLQQVDEKEGKAGVMAARLVESASAVSFAGVGNAAGKTAQAQAIPATNPTNATNPPPAANPSYARTTSYAPAKPTAPAAPVATVTAPAVVAPAVVASVPAPLKAAPNAEQAEAMVAANDSRLASLPFQIGVSSATVENIAKKIGCVGGKGAALISEKGPLEYYRMTCENGQIFKAKCELRQCKQI